MLHHDAITGTHGGSVNSDYKWILGDIKWEMDDSLVTLNISDTYTGNYDVLLYNPTAYIWTEIVELEVNS